MLKVFAVYDVKSASYGQPHFIASTGLALRTFGEVCLNPESPLFKYPQDFALYEIGTWDPSSGVLTTMKAKHVASAAAIISGVSVPAAAGRGSAAELVSAPDAQTNGLKNKNSSKVKA